MRTVVLQTSVMIVSCVFFVAFCEAGVSTPMPDSEEIPVGNRATANEMEYSQYWAFLQRSLPEHEQNFWSIFAFLITGVISIFIYLLQYCYYHWVSYRGDETKQEISHPMILLEKSRSLARELRRALPFMQGLAERRIQFQNDFDLLKFVKVEDERHNRFQNEVDLLKKMIKVDYERHAQFHNAMVSLKKMMNVADRRRVQLLNEVDSMKAIMKEEYKRRAVLQNNVDCMKTMMTKKVENERRAQVQNEIDSMRVMAVEDRPTAHSQQGVDSVKTMEVEGELLAHSPNEVDSAKIMKLTEETVGGAAYMEPPVKMGRPRENCIVASKATGEKKMAVPVNKVQAGLAPPPNLKAARAKVMSRSNPIHRAAERRVKIHNEKLDYSKVQPKVNFRSNISLQGDGDKSSQQNETTLRPGGGKGGQFWLYYPNQNE